MKLVEGYIEKTGGLPATDSEMEDFFFSHLVLKEETSQEDCLDLIKKHGVDFISVEMSGSFTFYHLTNPDNLGSISQVGLVSNQSEYISDLGKGIYVVKDGDEEGEQHLLDYIESHDDVDRWLFVKGKYEGLFTKCIYGEGHIGYYVLKEDVSIDNLENWDDFDVEDLLFNGIEI